MPKDFRQFLQEYVPAAALDYCAKLWQEHPFSFTISKSRMSKLGDYRYEPKIKRHTITVNHDLNPYAFLLTFIHEVAHQRVRLRYNRRMRPHGEEWKREFRELLEPLLKEEVYPEPLLKVLKNHMQNPKASSGSDPALTQALRQYDQKRDGKILLAELPEGGIFRFRQRFFRKVAKKRTRTLCTELPSGRGYLIAEIAEVTPFTNEELLVMDRFFTSRKS
jgi:SprT protein